MNRLHPPRKRFGQHYLQDRVTIDRIIATFHAQPGQHIIEIGPGKGALTIPLLQCTGEIHVIEVDRDLAAFLASRCQTYGTLHIHVADVLQFDFSRVPASDLRIIGNLPYNISTPLLFHLLDHRDRVRDMLFMLQKEVVERICAPPGNRDYGRLSVMMQYYYETDLLFSIGPEVFAPAPRVESAVIRLTPWHESPYEKTDTRVLSRIVKAAFSQRRKTLRNALRGIIPEASLDKLGIASSRAETLPVEVFVALANLPAADSDPSPVQTKLTAR